MDLDELADELLGGEGGVNLSHAGPHSGEFSHRIMNKSSIGDDNLDPTVQISPLIATMFWRIFIASPAYARELSRAGASPAAALTGEPVIVRHGSGSRHDMIVFDPYFVGDAPKSLNKIEVSDDDLLRGLKYTIGEYPENHGINRFRIPDTVWRDTLMQDSHSLYRMAREVMEAQRFGLIVAPFAKVLFTASIPTNAVKVELTPGKPCSTVGITGRDSMNRQGVTTALHALQNRRNILVDGQVGNVVSEDSVSDSCFIELLRPLAPTHCGFKGPLKGVTPRVNEAVHFHSMNRGYIRTIVTGWSYDVPFHFRGSQLKVFTKAVTQPGDSGTALRDENDYVLGFSFLRTEFKAKIEFAAWIWAECVYDIHSLD